MAYDDLRSFLRRPSTRRASCCASPRRWCPSRTSPPRRTPPRAWATRAPALYFDNVTGFTDARIAMNVHGSWANHALALGLPKEDRSQGTGARSSSGAGRTSPSRPSGARTRRGPRTPSTGDDVDIFDGAAAVPAERRRRRLLYRQGRGRLQGPGGPRKLRQAERRHLPHRGQGPAQARPPAGAHARHRPAPAQGRGAGRGPADRHRRSATTR